MGPAFLVEFVDLWGLGRRRAQWLAILPAFPWIGGVAPDSGLPIRVATIVRRQSRRRIIYHVSVVTVRGSGIPGLALPAPLRYGLASPVARTISSNLFCGCRVHGAIERCRGGRHPDRIAELPAFHACGVAPDRVLAVWVATIVAPQAAVREKNWRDVVLVRRLAGPFLADETGLCHGLAAAIGRAISSDAFHSRGTIDGCSCGGDQIGAEDDLRLVTVDGLRCVVHKAIVGVPECLGVLARGSLHLDSRDEMWRIVWASALRLPLDDDTPHVHVLAQIHLQPLTKCVDLRGPSPPGALPDGRATLVRARRARNVLETENRRVSAHVLRHILKLLVDVSEHSCAHGDAPMPNLRKDAHIASLDGALGGEVDPTALACEVTAFVWRFRLDEDLRLEVVLHVRRIGRQGVSTPVLADDYSATEPIGIKSATHLRRPSPDHGSEMSCRLRVCPPWRRVVFANLATIGEIRGPASHAISHLVVPHVDCVTHLDTSGTISHILPSRSTRRWEIVTVRMTITPSHVLNIVLCVAGHGITPS